MNIVNKVIDVSTPNAIRQGRQFQGERPWVILHHGGWLKVPVAVLSFVAATLGKSGTFHSQDLSRRRDRFRCFGSRSGEGCDAKRIRGCDKRNAADVIPCIHSRFQVMGFACSRVLFSGFCSGELVGHVL